ncbi:MAG TPA: DUF4097 family beta strand repeat-containing protein, partial [Candidatus Ozemobacteraceae bacterium]|nr:DUF4097 family beta strand repeat-containing protein [Candidatus Ozemobacteraceae bacterium]
LRLDFETDSASVKVAGAFGIGRGQTISGDVMLRHVEIEEGGIDTISGDISLENGAVRGKLGSTSGNVILKGVRLASVRVHTISGDVLVSDADIGDVTDLSIETTSGDVAIEHALGSWSRIDAGTRTGDLELRWQGVSRQSGGAGTIVESGQPGASFHIMSTSGDITFA